MINRQLLSLAKGAWRLILRNVAVGLAITATYAGQGFATAAILSDVFRGRGRGRGLGSVLGLVGVIAVLLAVRACLMWLRELGGTLIAGRVKRVVRERLYRWLLGLGPGYTSGTRTGQAQAAIVDAVEALEKYYSRFLPQFAVTVIGAAVLAAYVTSVDAVVGAIVIGGAVLASLIGSRLIMRPAMKRWFADYRSLYAESLDAVQGMTTLKAFNAHERRRRDLHAEGARFADASIGLMIASSWPTGLVGVAASSGIALSVGSAHCAWPRAT